MAHHRLGHTEKAIQYLDQAAQWIEQAERENPGDNRVGNRLPWDQRLIFQLLRREAEGLMDGPQLPNDAQALPAARPGQL
jgi:hypothetical protein